MLSNAVNKSLIPQDDTYKAFTPRYKSSKMLRSNHSSGLCNLWRLVCSHAKMSSRLWEPS